jgi:hypothetical protein
MQRSSTCTKSRNNERREEYIRSWSTSSMPTEGLTGSRAAATMLPTIELHILSSEQRTISQTPGHVTIHPSGGVHSMQAEQNGDDVPRRPDYGATIRGQGAQNEIRGGARRAHCRTDDADRYWRRFSSEPVPIMPQRLEVRTITSRQQIATPHQSAPNVLLR